LTQDESVLKNTANLQKSAESSWQKTGFPASRAPVGSEFQLPAIRYRESFDTHPTNVAGTFRVPQPVAQLPQNSADGISKNACCFGTCKVRKFWVYGPE
jgi:hypothetical protein